MPMAVIAAFAMEFMPRITRAQVMDVLSSQANLAGYRAVVDGAAEYGRALPMMMTAAGTVPAAASSSWASASPACRPSPPRAASAPS
jgi:NAD(P) transhydrogenase subunit alpha